MILELSVFICGAAVMALELSGARVLAPYLGTSSFVWTSLIGIVLAALSVGYSLGGNLIDKYPEKRFYSRLILIAGLLTASVTLLQYPVLIALTGLVTDLRIAAVLASVFLFAAPSIALGTILPSAVRLRLDDVEHSGKKVGRLYAISTLGSIVGTFGAGFFLLALIGTNMMFFLIGFTLVCTSLLVDPKALRFTKVASAIALLFTAYLLEDIRSDVEKRGMRDFDTEYQRVMVVETEATPHQRLIRYLVTDPLGSQSAMYPDAPSELVGSYSRFYRMLMYYQPDPKDILLLGGGAYSLPKSMLGEHPQMQMDVVELDPGITEIAKKHFALEPGQFGSRLSIYHQDARTFLNQNSKRYDALFLDVFGSSPTVPFHLTTREAVLKMKQALKPEGVLIANVITAIEGDAGSYLRAQLRTFEEVFPDVALYPVSEIEDGTRVQNIIIIARLNTAEVQREASPEVQDFLAHRWRKKIPRDVPVLEDNYAPVEYYMTPALLAMRRQHLEESKTSD